MKADISKRIENEIEHGKKLHSEGAESIWNWSSAAGQLRADRRAKYFIRYANVKAGDPVLELGCGTGIFTRKFYEATKARITAVDISDDLLGEAKKLLPQADFLKEDAMNLSFESNTFEAVFGSSVLHHLEFEPALQEIYRVLKPGGRMVFAEPNMLNPQVFFQKNIAFLKKWLGDSPDESAIIRWTFLNLMTDKGFRNINIFPYDFLHPIVPRPLTDLVSSTGKVLEKIPILREIAGSVIIYGEK